MYITKKVGFASVPMILGIIVCWIAQGCGSQSSSASGSTASMQFGTYTAFNRYIDPLMGLFATPAEAASSNIFICVHRVRFKAPEEGDTPDDASTDTDNDDVSKDNRVGQQGWLPVSATGPFGTVDVPHAKLASKVRIDVDNHCVGHPSVQFTTSAGGFSSTSSFTMEFDSSTGAEVDLTHNNTVGLGFQPVNNAIDALSAGATDAQIVAALTTVGTM